MQHKLFLGLILSSFLTMIMAAPPAIDGRIQGDSWPSDPRRLADATIEGRVQWQIYPSSSTLRTAFPVPSHPIFDITPLLCLAVPPPSLPSSHSYIAALALATASASAFFSLLPSVSLLSAFFLQVAFTFASPPPALLSLFLLLSFYVQAEAQTGLPSISFASPLPAPRLLSASVPWDLDLDLDLDLDYRVLIRLGVRLHFQSQFQLR
ncbi:hypothetical protein B0H13DRAFT_2376413 [Mycena leptocephala]|nr:hypothetical protein B0H13DRAFT_2376413 [Mycena leptocephala]